jgi:hypothetical protein
MGWFKKKPDPISDRARALNEQIAALEAQIQQLDSKLAEGKPGPRLRSTTMPRGASSVPHAAATSIQPAPKATDPIFEEVDQNRLKGRSEASSTPEHYNELGVRKYDLAALFRRLKNQFSGPSTANPKLVSYLAAGSLQGLRPMRYEKRIARNRFLVFFIILFLTLAGIIAMFAKHRG